MSETTGPAWIVDKALCRLLSEHGKEIDEGLGYAVLSEFWQWFHEHVFA